MPELLAGEGKPLEVDCFVTHARNEASAPEGWQTPPAFTVRSHPVYQRSKILTQQLNMKSFVFSRDTDVLTSVEPPPTDYVWLLFSSQFAQGGVEVVLSQQL